MVSRALAAGVKISHVNFMTMDYGDSFGGKPLAPVVTGTLIRLIDGLGEMGI